MNTAWSSQEIFKIDLNSVRDDNRVVALMGYLRPQVVPHPGDMATAVDEDGSFYDAVVDAVLPESRVYLRVRWATKRTGMTLPDLSYGQLSYGVR